MAGVIVDSAATVWLHLTLGEGGCHVVRKLKSLMKNPYEEEIKLPSNSLQSPSVKNHMIKHRDTMSKPRQ